MLAPDAWRLNQSDGIQALGSLIDLFEAQARRTPSRIAASLMGLADHLTYSALSEQSGRLARRLSASGAGPGSIVGVHLERTPRYLTAILAVLKCGSAFMPLDAKYPRGRLEFMVQDSGAKLLITDSRLAGNIKTNSSHSCRNQL
jgi:non-ribosomal peptide synthetase component F